MLAAAPEKGRRGRKAAKRSGKGQGSADLIDALLLVIALVSTTSRCSGMIYRTNTLKYLRATMLHAFPENGHNHSRSTHSLTRNVKRSVALGLPTDAKASFHAHAAPSSIQFGGYTRRLFQSDTVGSYVYPGSSYPAMRDREGKRESQQAREGGQKK